MSVYGITRRTAQQRKPMESALLKVAVIALLVVGIAGSSVVTLHIEAAPEPTDIEDCWAEEAIVALIDEGIITGYPDGTF